MKNNEPLRPGYFYHIYNRGNNRENLFYSQRNYIYFLQKYDQYLYEYVETYAYCLLPNHFHLLVRVKVDLPGLESKIPSFEKMESIISSQFRRFFISYSMSVNKQQNRVGSLFQKNFKRILVKNVPHLTNLIYYIHANPQIHGLIDDFRNWPYSSYGKIVEARKSHLMKEEILKYFGSREEYQLYHKMVHDDKKIRSLIIE